MVSPDGPLRPIPVKDLLSEPLKPQEAYKQAFLDAAHTRGITADTLQSVKDSGCLTLLEATLDDTDGQIELPPPIRNFISKLYPETDILIEEVVTDDEIGSFRIDLDGPPYTWRTKELHPEVPDDDTLIAPPGVRGNQFVNKQVYFNIPRGIMGQGSRPEPNYFTQDGQEETEIWEEFAIPEEVLSEFPKIPGIILQRTNSKISHYDNLTEVMSYI